MYTNCLNWWTLFKRDAAVHWKAITNIWYTTLAIQKSRDFAHA